MGATSKQNVSVTQSAQDSSGKYFNGNYILDTRLRVA